jgi:integrase
MKPRDRVTAAGLLPRMEARPWKDGKTVSYRYHPVGGTPVKLGTDKLAAIQQVLDMSGRSGDAGTFAELWRLYKVSPEWLKLAEATRTDYEQCWKQLEPRFAAAAPARVRPTDVNRYLRVERVDAPVRANREMALLSNLFNLGISRGDLDTNPCRQVRRNTETPRSEAPETDQLKAFVDWLTQQGGQRKVTAQMAEFVAYGGSRRVEFRRIVWPQIDRPGRVIRVLRAKQRGQVIWDKIEIGPRMEDLLDRIQRGKAEFVFCNRFGNPYTEKGFKANWGRFMREAMKAKVISKRFTFHDLRAYYATTHKEERGTHPDLHKNTATTARIYDRRKEVKRGAL